MVITKIERQKKNKSRFSVFIDEEYAFSVGEEVYGKFILHQGQELNDDQRREIETTESESTVKRAALRFRSYRPRSTHEVREFLRKKGYEDLSIDRGVEYLVENKLLDDGEFARMLGRDRLKLRPVGRFSMKQIFMKKGIDRSVIDSVLDELYDESIETELAQREADRKNKRIASIPALKRKKRIYDHLVRKGFNSSLSMKIVNQLVKQ